MKRIRCYLSGKITGNEDYMRDFAEAEEKLSDLGFSVVNPARVCMELPTDTDYIDYIKISRSMLETCDRIYMIDGWERSNGATYELMYASLAGMPVLNRYGAEKWKTEKGGERMDGQDRDNGRGAEDVRKSSYRA